MQVWTRNKPKRTYRYPEEMEKILKYLKANGELHIDEAHIEECYETFSDVCYSASWMIVDDDLLEEFADWLENNDILI